MSMPASDPSASREKPPGTPGNVALDRERYRLATHISRTLHTPMTILGLVWLVLLVIDFTKGLPPFAKHISYVIWGLFVVQFLVEFTLAPRKVQYLRHNWLTAIALLVPALRLLSVFRALRALTALRGLRLVRVVGSMNRGMRSLGSVMRRRGFGYAVALSIIVTLAGAAGMYAFEGNVPGSGVSDFGSALWWTAMTLTTLGTDFFPRTSEGRVLVFCSRCMDSRCSAT